MEFQQAFGVTLRRLRLAKGLTQEKFYDIVSESYISKLETGKRVPTWPLVTELAAILDIDPLALITMAVAEQRGVDALALSEQVDAEIKKAVSLLQRS